MGYKNKTNRRERAPRITGQFTVHSKTIGSLSYFKLNTENISKSGLLLNWTQQSSLPFIEKTLLDLQIDPERQYFKEPILCLGKVVRREVKKDGHAGAVELGIQIVQIDEKHKHAWENHLEKISFSYADQ